MQAPAAFASVLDYNAAGSGFVGPTVTEDGFDTTAPAGLFITSGGEAAAAFAGDEVTITRVGGGAFSLSSIDFRLFSQSSFSFTVTGDQVGGGSVTQSISGLTTSLQTYSFGPEFSDLVAVHYTQGPSTTGEDDVIFDNVIVTAVPEPTSIALLGLGLAGLGFRKRKKLWSFSGQTGHADLIVLATMPRHASRP